MMWNKIRTIDWKSYFLMFSTSPLTEISEFFIKKGKRLLCIFKQWKRHSESYLFLLSWEGLTTDWCVGFSELAFFWNNVPTNSKRLAKFNAL